MVDIDIAEDGDEQPPEEHDNSAHSETFAVDGDEQPPEEHDNDAHSESYTTESEAADAAPVQSVNGEQGTVDLDAADVGAESDGAVSDHSDSTQNVHGVGFSDVESEDGAQSKADDAQSNAESYADTQVSDHAGETQNVHGVGGSDVESTSGAQSKVDDHEDKGNPHSDSAGTNVGVEQPVFSSKDDVPNDITQGETVYIDGDGLYVEDGT